MQNLSLSSASVDRCIAALKSPSTQGQQVVTEKVKQLVLEFNKRSEQRQRSLVLDESALNLRFNR